MSVGKRIKEIRLLFKMTQAEFAKKIGTVQGYLTQIENGTRIPNETHILLICERFNIQESWLRIGNGDMLKRTQKDIFSDLSEEFHLDKMDDKLISTYVNLPKNERNIIKKYLKSVFETNGNSDELITDTNTIEQTDKIELVSVKVYHQSAAAGFGNYLYENSNDNFEYINFKIGDVPYGVDFGIKISGHSMEPKISDGSIVFVKALPAIPSGQVGIFILNRKRIYTSNPGGYPPLVYRERFYLLDKSIA